MEMRFCNEHGIPHSKWLSWEPEDRAKQIAYMLEDADRCSLCGTAEWEWEANRFAYTPVEEFCKGCYQKAVFTDTETDKSMPGTNVRLVPTTKEFTAKQLIRDQKRRELLSRE